MEKEKEKIWIMVDEDEWKVKEEIYRVEERKNMKVVIVEKSLIEIKREEKRVERVVV